MKYLAFFSIALLSTASLTYAAAPNDSVELLTHNGLSSDGLSSDGLPAYSDASGQPPHYSDLSDEDKSPEDTAAESTDADKIALITIKTRKFVTDQLTGEKTPVPWSEGGYNLKSAMQTVGIFKVASAPARKIDIRNHCLDDDFDLTPKDKRLDKDPTKAVIEYFNPNGKLLKTCSIPRDEINEDALKAELTGSPQYEIRIEPYFVHPGVWVRGTKNISSKRKRYLYIESYYDYIAGPECKQGVFNVMRDLLLGKIAAQSAAKNPQPFAPIIALLCSVPNPRKENPLHAQILTQISTDDVDCTLQSLDLIAPEDKIETAKQYWAKNPGKTLTFLLNAAKECKLLKTDHRELNLLAKKDVQSWLEPLPEKVLTFEDNNTGYPQVFCHGVQIHRNWREFEKEISSAFSATAQELFLRGPLPTSSTTLS